MAWSNSHQLRSEQSPALEVKQRVADLGKANAYLQTGGSQNQPRSGVHQKTLAQRGAFFSDAVAKRGRLEVHERKRHELGESAFVCVILLERFFV